MFLGDDPLYKVEIHIHRRQRPIGAEKDFIPACGIQKGMAKFIQDERFATHLL
jgi:hypothetical protein